MNICIVYDYGLGGLRNYTLGIGGSITWAGHSFKGSSSRKGESGKGCLPIEAKRWEVSEDFSGAVSPDGKTLISFSGHHKSISYFKIDGKIAGHKEYSFSIANLNFEQVGKLISREITASNNELQGNVSVSNFIDFDMHFSNHDERSRDYKFVSVCPNGVISVRF